MTVDDLMAAYPAGIRAITDALRTRVLAEDGVSEIVHPGWKNITYSARDRKRCYIAPFKNHVNFGVYDPRELPDDLNEVLSGAGKTMRHLTIRSDEPFPEETVTQLVDYAFDIARL